MVDTVEDALERLARDASSVLDRLPPRLRGTVRFDVQEETRTTHWFVTLGTGKVRVSSTGAEPDSIVRSERVRFDRLARGEDRFIPLLFRNAVVVEGDLGLADQLCRVLFGSVPAGLHPRDFTRREAAENEREDSQHPGREHLRGD
ncbi:MULTISPECIES: SCP2 sterol-binding domain-containing protein [unclassified Solwaraspora]|uniref:SCP2 sterol-binding domain-containing protein n=1 Tax=unclassified Solwaraspora TaxID=2627926 RepID=UPI00248BD0B2|nr:MULTISPECIES: SCP2 sterol-binding domain-containing protein [unclassified Solwaraspora]WBB99351.1 SCP2 sterol-binding domain-containing protein [Solwaraspora sp. WMMA2059]WBC22099.1 SCP2 sterol-binding domain-containing protein [Solwaraspora sp. WMMA2080]WJK35857.1 SCP2 sterol-binding domain-containing protein [Solwaraspora sp. WMMA2065]